MSELNERLRQQLAAEYQPDAEMDAKLRWSTERINTELPPEERMAFGRYQAQKEAFEQQRREERAAAARAARAQTGA